MATATPIQDDAITRADDIKSLASTKHSPSSLQVTINHPVSTKTMRNPLSGMNADEIKIDVEDFLTTHKLEQYRSEFYSGALLAQQQDKPLAELEASLPTWIGDGEKQAARRERKDKWASSPPVLYFLCALCAGCAVVQGMDQTVVNGAQSFYLAEFKITDPIMQGLLNGAPYAAAALLGCWLNAPLNSYFGRRGTIFFSCLIAFITNIWQAASPNWPSFLAARLTLGVAVGAKSSTVPVYAAEAAPKNIRGALTMMWQMWTAFGIMLGFAASLAFQKCEFLGQYSPWRWMIGVTALPPVVVMALVYLVPESPRWLMDKGRYKCAYDAMRRLRSHDVLAARDVYLAHKYLQIERRSKKGRNLLREFFTRRRNLRAAQSSWFCMFMQQFCGVNVIAYYSTQIFFDAGYSRETALLASFGCGALNWIGALPAVFTIDRFGRRNLLLLTLPLLSACLFWTGGSFQIGDEQAKLRTDLVVASIYIFMFVYSPGMGPVPFTYSAEAFPLHIRSQGMASATALTWALNFVISLTWPKMVIAFTPSGAFYWYGAWNIVGFVFAWFLLPETKERTLEELDVVFSMRNRVHAGYYWRRLEHEGRRMLGKAVGEMGPLYEVEEVDEEKIELVDMKPNKR